MSWCPVLLLVVAQMANPELASGQSAGSAPAATAPASGEQTSPTPAPVDASKMGISLDRIKRELNQARAVEQETPEGALRLSFTVEVVGRAPKIDLLKDFPLIGPVYGAPTHREVIDFLTPQAYKAPVVPFYSMAVWAAQKLWERSKKQRCEDEIADYRRLVMAGVAVAAPRCNQ